MQATHELNLEAVKFQLPATKEDPGAVNIAWINIKILAIFINANSPKINPAINLPKAIIPSLASNDTEVIRLATEEVKIDDRTVHVGEAETRGTNE